MYENIPYLSILYDKKEESTVLCLIQLLTKNCISYFCINELKNNDYKDFFNLTDTWWKCCPLIPISLYFRDEFKRFNYCKHHLYTNDYQIIGGFSGVNLKYLSEKRIKRKMLHID